MAFRSFALGAIAAAAVAATAPAVAADSFAFTGTGSTGVSFSGTVTYDPLATASELTISLTNTTSAAIGGFMTGLAFDVPGVTSIGSFTTTHADMTLLTNPSTAPFGSRGWGVAVGGDWLGGGNPSGGVATGATGTWTFDLTGGPSSLSLADLNMVARFRGLNDGGSDKVPAVPEPETWAMMLAGAAALWLRQRRRGAAPVDAQPA